MVRSVDTVGAYWGPRRENATQCAARLQAYLAALAGLGAPFEQWYLKGANRRTAEAAAGVAAMDRSGLTALLESRRNRDDVSGQPIEDLGFRLALWNRLPDETAIGINITCGLYETRGRLSNAVVMTLPPPSTLLPCDSDDLLSQLLLAHVRSWEPDWVAAFAVSSESTQRGRAGGPFLDRMLWLKEGAVSEEVGGASTRRVPIEQGVLLVCAD
jgi:hypothetical protein